MAIADLIAVADAGRPIGIEVVAPGVPDMDDVGLGVKIEDRVKVGLGDAWRRLGLRRAATSEPSQSEVGTE